MLDLIRGRRVTAIGAATAIIVGCVLITPAGGFISPGWALALGFLGAFPCYFVILYRPRTRVDETLDVLAAHGVAGFTGILAVGFIAQASWNGISDGILYGNPGQLLDQVLADLAGPAYAFVMTYALLRAIGFVTSLRGVPSATRPWEWTSSTTARRPTPPARARSSSRPRTAARRRSRSRSPSSALVQPVRVEVVLGHPLQPDPVDLARRD